MAAAENTDVFIVRYTLGKPYISCVEGVRHFFFFFFL